MTRRSGSMDRLATAGVPWLHVRMPTCQYDTYPVAGIWTAASRAARTGRSSFLGVSASPYRHSAYSVDSRPSRLPDFEQESADQSGSRRSRGTRPGRTGRLSGTDIPSPWFNGLSVRASGAGLAWRLSGTGGLLLLSTTRWSHPTRGGSKKSRGCARMTRSSNRPARGASLVGQLRRSPRQGRPSSRCPSDATSRDLHRCKSSCWSLFVSAHVTESSASAS